jgi:hypothetical protein
MRHGTDRDIAAQRTNGTTEIFLACAPDSDGNIIGQPTKERELLCA